MRTMTALVTGLVLAVALSGCSRPTGVAAAADAMQWSGALLQLPRLLWVLR